MTDTPHPNPLPQGEREKVRNMSILIDENKKVLVQGITGREGTIRTKLMLQYGTNVVAGCTPGKRGQLVQGVPVFNDVAEAIKEIGPVDASVLYIPAPQVKDAALEAFKAGIKFLVIVPDRVPIWDILEISEQAKKHKAKFLGPNTLGILSPGRAVLGMIGGSAASAKSWFKRGPVGVSSRSGGITSSMSYYLNKAGIGQTTIVHVGGDAIIGLPQQDIMMEFEKDEETKLVVMFGEIGTSQEETVADLIERGEFTKPLVAFIGGKAAKKGTRFSHAGAIVEGDKGSWEGKVKRLKEAGAHVVENFEDIPSVTKKVLESLKIKGLVMQEKDWKTKITKIEPNKIMVRGYKIDELMGKVSYGEMLYLILKGEMPSKETGKMMETILVSSIDHGVTPPSTLAALTAASTGASLNSALACGILSINRHHGGAIEDTMNLILEGVRTAKEKKITLDQVAKEMVLEYRKKNLRFPGLGHRIHTKDPRTKKLFSMADELKLSGEHVKFINALAEEFEKETGKSLPVNVDGAIGAVLCDLGFSSELANGFFIIARMPGLLAHVIEERTQEKPMRDINPKEHMYTGHEERTFKR